MKSSPLLLSIFALALVVPSALGESPAAKPDARQEKARPYLEKALAESAKITDGEELAQVLATIVWAQTEVGDLAGAFKTVQRVEKEVQREFAKKLCLGHSLRHIAYSQAKSGHAGAALETAKKLGTIMGETVELGDPFAVGVIAKAQAENGDVESALRTANSLKIQKNKDMALQRITGVQLRAGDKQGAERTAEVISDAQMKAAALKIYQAPKTEPPVEAGITAMPTAKERCQAYLKLVQSSLSSDS